MGIVLMQILQWILRIILFLLLLLLILLILVMVVPIRYRAEGEVLEKKPKVKGKITWFFYLLYMTFVYEEDFCMQVRLLGFKIFDTENNKENKEQKDIQESMEDTIENTLDKIEEDVFEKDSFIENVLENKLPDEIEKNKSTKYENNENEILENTLNDAVKNIEETKIAENEIDRNADENFLQKLEERQRNESERNNTQKAENSLKQKKTLSEKINSIKLKILEIIQKTKDIFSKIKEGKLKIDHYLELWNRKATQITFQRAKKKLWKMITAVLPRKWILTGEIGFDNPCTTGQFMGILGAMYPFLGNKVRIIPNFEQKIMNIQGEVKGRIRLGTFVYQVISLLLNRHCFKFIKMIFDELSGSKKKEKEI